MKSKKQTRLRSKLPQYATIVFSGRTRRVRVPQKIYVYKQKTTSGWMSSLWCAGRVREPTAAGGRCREADEVKTTSRQGCAPSCRSMRRLFFRAEPDGFESHGNICIKTKKQITEVTCFMVRWKGLEPLTP